MVSSVNFLKMLTNVNILARAREVAVLAFEFKGFSQEPIVKLYKKIAKTVNFGVMIGWCFVANDSTKGIFRVNLREFQKSICPNCAKLFSNLGKYWGF